MAIFLAILIFNYKMLEKTFGGTELEDGVK